MGRWSQRRWAPHPRFPRAPGRSAARHGPEVPALGSAGEQETSRDVASVCRVRLEYVQAAAPSAVLAGAAWPERIEGDAAWAWRLADPADGRDVARGLVLPG